MVLPSNASSIQARIGWLDALRGSIVFAWLLATIWGPVLLEFPNSSLAQTLAAQFSNSFWDGVTIGDLVLPLFLFVTGASIGPAFQRRRAAGQSSRQLSWRILRRLALLSVIGVLCEGGVIEHWPYLRFVGSFQRIAVCYAVVATLDVTTSWQFQAGLLGFLLVDYATILTFGANGGSAAVYSFESNAVATVDQLFLPGAKYFGTWDSQGILTTMPSLAVTIAGLLASRVPMTTGLGSGYRSFGLLLIGLVSINAGILADNVIPVNPYLWTLPFCFIAIGAGTASLGAFHAALDEKRAIRSAACLTALGRNSVFVVLMTLAFSNGLKWAMRFAWLRLHLGLNSGNPLWALFIFVAACGIALFLDRRRLYITV